LNDRLKSRVTSGGYRSPSSPCTSFQHKCTKYKVIVTEDVDDDILAIPKLEKECPCASQVKGGGRKTGLFVYYKNTITEGVFF
jgi:hypothetical protein